jgi:hypothetical protein
MEWWDRLRGRSAVDARIQSAVDDGARLGRALAGGRASSDASEALSGFSPLAGYVLPPPDAESTWRWEQLDSDTLRRVPLSRLLLLLADLSPEVSKALWDWQRFNNPGYELHAYRPGTETVDERAERSLKAFETRLAAQYGAIDVVLAGLFAGPFFRGAFFAELVLDPRGRLPVDLVTPDPAIARFRRQDDAVRGPIWQLGQADPRAPQGFRPLDRPTVRYLPLDPVFSPYGRPLIAPAVFSALFLLSLLHDLKRVVQQQGYKRLDVSLDLEAMKKAVPQLERSTLAEVSAFIEAQIGKIQEAFRNLKPDDTYVHDKAIIVNRPVGTADADSLGAIDALIRALERFLSRATKSAPFLLGLSESTTETQAIRQFEAFTQGIRAVQHHAENLLRYLFTLGLQAEGIRAEVRWRFAENRASEQLRDEQVRLLRNRNTAYEYDRGWASQDEAAEKTVGHKPDQAAPRTESRPASTVPPPAKEPGNGVAPGALVAAANGAVGDG